MASTRYTTRTDVAPERDQRARHAWQRSTSFGDFLSDILEPAVTENSSPSSTPLEQSASVYTIGVAARLVQMHPQTLRKYDRESLVSPSRTGGMQRLYSDEDLERLRAVGRLIDDLGLNHDGVALVLELASLMQDVVAVFEHSPDVSGTRAARLAAQEMRRVITYLSGDDS